MAEGFNKYPYSIDGQNSSNHEQETNSATDKKPGKKNYNKQGRSQGKKVYTNKNYDKGKIKSQQKFNKEPMNFARDRSKSPIRNTEHQNQKEIDRNQLIQLEFKDPENIILFFSKNNFAFKKLLSDTSDFNKVVLFLRVISKLCSSSFVEYKTKIITEILNKDFLQKLQIHIYNLAVQNEREKQDNLFFWQDQNRFWNNILILYNAISDVSPKRACAKLPKIITANIIALKDIMRNNLVNFDNITAEFEDLHRKIEEEKLKKDSFREMDVYPTIKEITSRKEPVIEALKKEGGYASVEDYLNVHFRLLREDYVRSLRNGICTYLENQNSGENKKQNDVRIYEGVKFMRPHVTKDRVGILINYSLKEQSGEKVFRHGALVCFTKDNFQSIVYGTIIDNDIELLQQGFIVVDIQDAILYGQNYIMLESTIFFETYHQVLKALQSMRENSFPMKKYLVDLTRKVHPPRFLNNQTKIIFSATVNPKKSDAEPVKFFKMLLTNSWPSKEYFKLNSSQFSAFQTALTTEFSVIQGPPGTGKTYTGYKIVEFLLKHKQSLKYSGPILVLCYSNHALDQFLEGILPICNEVVRVGSQSKNPKMNDFNLKCLRRKIENDSICKELFEVEKEKYEQCLQKLQCLQNLLEDITCKMGVLDFKLFKAIDLKFENSWFDITDSENIIRWLTTDMNLDVPKLYNSTPVEVSQKPYSKSATNKTKIIKQNKNYDSDTDFVNNCIITLPEIKSKIKDLRFFTDDLRYNQKASYTVINNCEKENKELQKKEEYFQWRMNETSMKPHSKVDYNSPFNISPNERWELYRHWVHLLHLQTYEDISILDEEYRAAKRRYQEIQDIVDTYIMQQKSVIGMTTSRAAQLQPVLQTLKCEIVIVEEAAEVLESHIVASLTNHCQQLILIGDHFQLRPNTSQYELAKHYNLDVSLFERMINNGIHYQQLQIQHRMRPEFCKLITPAIYPNLKNDDTVLCYPPIRGLAKNLFFITHNQFEQRIRESTSHRNIYEAKYLARFATYLVRQGYNTDEITILTTYAGQQTLLTMECRNFEQLQNIRITNVDNFQGEENKIILLSLVRSNEKDNIGFVKIENRVCVALSRAKEGFYMIGNMDNLEKSSKIWPKIVESLQEQNSIGPSIILKCQIHGTKTKISSYDNFDYFLDGGGGCHNICGGILKCEHTCQRECHLSDREHKEDVYNCREPCKKTICQQLHLCPNRCSEPCAKKCFKSVQKKSICGHSNVMPCSQNISDYKCTETKIVQLSCGHQNIIKCNDSLSLIKCSSRCESNFKCGHKCNRFCHTNNDPDHQSFALNICKEVCGKINVGCSTLSHKCTRLCSQACALCTVSVVKIRNVCNHASRISCYKDVNLEKCTAECGRIMQCGHLCTNQCGVACGQCQIIVEKVVPTCGHKVSIQCGLIPQTYMCRRRCPIILPCKHQCKKNCNEKCECSKCKCSIL